MSKRYLKNETFGQRYGVDPSGLVLWLDQSDPRSYGDLSNWYDLSGNGNHGTQAVGGSQPAITGADGLNGSARQFDGTADWIEIADSASLSITGDLSVFCWFRSNDITDEADGGGHRLVVKGNTVDGADANYALRVTGSKLTVSITNGGATVVDSGVLQSDTWYHGGLIYDGSSLQVSVDGVFVNSTPAAVVLRDGPGQLAIGARQDGARHLDGFIDTAIIFSRGLTDAEVNLLYLADVARHGGL